MEIDEDLARAAGRSRTFEGKPLFFCSERCARECDADPAGHAAPKDRGESPGHGGHAAEVVPSGHPTGAMPGMAAGG